MAADSRAHRLASIDIRRGLPQPGACVLWALVIAILHPFSVWVGNIEARRWDWWLSYVSAPEWR